MRGRFAKWLKTVHQAEKISDLFQGDQLDGVMSFLRQKMEKLQIK